MEILSILTFFDRVEKVFDVHGRSCASQGALGLTCQTTKGALVNVTIDLGQDRICSHNLDLQTTLLVSHQLVERLCHLQRLLSWSLNSIRMGIFELQVELNPWAHVVPRLHTKKEDQIGKISICAEFAHPTPTLAQVL